MSEKKSKDKSEGLPRGTYYYADPDELTIIGLDTDDGPEHPLYDSRIHRPLDPARVRNFQYHGVLKPVEARRNDGRLEIVDGRGRVRYARAVKAIQEKAGEETLRVPVIVAKGDDAHLFGRSRAANLHDADGPMTTAKNVQRMLDMGRTLEEVADSFGVSQQTIRNYQSMLDLDPAVIDAMVKEEITSTAAVMLATLPKAAQKEVLDELQSEKKETGAKPTVERTKKKVAEKTGKASNTPKDRIERATNVMRKYVVKADDSKEATMEALKRVCRILTGTALEKLVDEE